MSPLNFWTIIGFVSGGIAAILCLNPSAFMRAFGRFEIMYFVILLLLFVVCIVALIVSGLYAPGTK